MVSQEQITLLLHCIDSTNTAPDFKVVGTKLGITTDAARKRYSRLRTQFDFPNSTPARRSARPSAIVQNTSGIKRRSPDGDEGDEGASSPEIHPSQIKRPRFFYNSSSEESEDEAITDQGADEHEPDNNEFDIKFDSEPMRDIREMMTASEAAYDNQTTDLPPADQSTYATFDEDPDSLFIPEQSPSEDEQSVVEHEEMAEEQIEYAEVFSQASDASSDPVFIYGGDGLIEFKAAVQEKTAEPVASVDREIIMPGFGPVETHTSLKTSSSECEWYSTSSGNILGVAVIETGKEEEVVVETEEPAVEQQSLFGRIVALFWGV